MNCRPITCQQVLLQIAFRNVLKCGILKANPCGSLRFLVIDFSLKNIESLGIYTIIEEINESKIEEYHDKIVDIISELPEDELQLIEMRFFEKRSFKEIAEILEIMENNAKVKTYRILEKLKKIII